MNLSCFLTYLMDFCREMAVDGAPVLEYADNLLPVLCNHLQPEGGRWEEIKTQVEWKHTRCSRSPELPSAPPALWNEGQMVKTKCLYIPARGSSGTLG